MPFLFDNQQSVVAQGGLHLKTRYLLEGRPEQKQQIGRLGRESRPHPTTVLPMLNMVEHAEALPCLDMLTFSLMSNVPYVFCMEHSFNGTAQGFASSVFGGLPTAITIYYTLEKLLHCTSKLSILSNVGQRQACW